MFPFAPKNFRVYFLFSFKFHAKKSNNFAIKMIQWRTSKYRFSYIYFRQFFASSIYVSNQKYLVQPKVSSNFNFPQFRHCRRLFCLHHFRRRVLTDAPDGCL